MPHVSVTIAGRVYRLACGEGEEPRLEHLAALVDSKTAEIRDSFGQIGDQRITVMAALTLADELSEATRKLNEAQSELITLQASKRETDSSATASTRAIAQSIDEAAMRIELIAQTLNTATRG